MHTSDKCDVPGIDKIPGVAKRWVCRVFITLLLVTNLWTIPALFLSAASDRTVIYGYSLFTLPDGTNGVVLAGGTVSYTPDFNQLYREYTTTNGGFFNVHHAGKLFVLHCAGGLVIRSLGGTFEVAAVPGGQHTTRVLVGTESVEITDLSGNSYGYFHAAEEATIDLATHTVVRKQYDKVFVSDRNIRAILRFERMSMVDAAVQLEKHFDVDIRVEPSIREFLIDATFPADVSLVEALEMLKLSNLDKRMVYKIVRDRTGEINYVTIDHK